MILVHRHLFKYVSSKGQFLSSKLWSSTGSRNFSETIALIYREHGDPVKMLHAEKSPLQNVTGDHVSIRMLAAPINPSDINQIQGVYPVKPSLPAIAGNEGVGEIEEIGPLVKNLKPGDWVVPADASWGTWRTRAVCSESEILQIPNDIPVEAAATMAVNPCTAYRLLLDFEKLEPGDIVIQNGANSGVGQSVIQIAAALGLITINIVRNREEIGSLTNYLEGLGATHVITDDFLRTPNMKSMMKYLPKPKLALNCVGGRATADLLKYLEKGCTMVTYGGMSKQPIMIPAGPLIFNDVKLCGYWNTNWNKENKHNPARAEMWKNLSDMIRNGELKAPTYEFIHMKKYHEAVENAMKPYMSAKQILAISDDLIEKIHLHP